MEMEAGCLVLAHCLGWVRLGFMKQSFEWNQQWRRIAFSETGLPCWIAFPNRFLFIPIPLNTNLISSSLLSLGSPLPFLPKTTSNFPTNKAISTPVVSPLSASSYLMVHLLSLHSSLHFIFNGILLLSTYFLVIDRSLALYLSVSVSNVNVINYTKVRCDIEEKIMPLEGEN